MDAQPPAAISKPEPQPSRAGFYIDLSAAIFGWLAVLFAVLAVILVFVGISNYREFKQRITTETTDRIQSEVAARVTAAATTQIDEVIAARLRPKVDEAIETAQARLKEEITRFTRESEWSESLVKEMKARVLERIAPQASATKPDEFESRPKE